MKLPKSVNTTKKHLTNDERYKLQLAEELLNKYDGEQIEIPVIIRDNEQAVKLFSFYVEQLIEMKLFVNIDCDLLATYCLLNILYQHLMEKVTQEGIIIGDKENPNSKVARGYLKDIITLEKQFPFTPLTRMQFRNEIADKQPTLIDILNSDDDTED